MQTVQIAKTAHALQGMHTAPGVPNARGVSQGPAGPDTCEIGLHELRFGGSPRFREEDTGHTRALAEIAAELLPPIIVHRPSMTVVDGLHRSRAALLRGERTIRARFFDGTPAEAFLLAVESNRAHGLPLSLSERKAAAVRLLAMFPDRSDRSVAMSAGLSGKTVAKLRCAGAENPQSNMRVGADERGRPIDGADRRRLAARLLALEPRTPLRQIAGEVGISPATVLDVRRRMARGEDPVPAGSLSRAAEHARAGFGLADRGTAAGSSGSGSAGAESAGPRPTDIRPADPGARDTRPADVRRPARRCPPGRRGPAHDPQTVLQHLRNDPALKSSETGRDLLRWLHSTVPSRERCDALVGNSPPHCRDLIADLAEVYAEGWYVLSRRLRNERGGF